MSRDKYRNPPAPLGYNCQLQLKEDSREQDIAFLLGMKDLCLDFKDEDLSSNLSDFIILTSDEEEKSAPVEVIEENKRVVTESSVKKKKLKSKPNSKKSSPKHSDDEKKDSRHRSPERKKRDRYDSGSASDSSMNSSRKSHYPQEEDWEEPEHLFGTYHCDVCNLTLNSECTYESHINGKKHRKALKAKNTVDTVSKTVAATEAECKKPRVPQGCRRIRLDEDALIQDLINQHVKNPCPGLWLVTEIQGISETSYYCSLCDSPCSTNSIYPHLNGFKHQLRCVKHFMPHIYETIKYEQKYQVEGRVLKVLKDVERREGRGSMTVERDIIGKGGPYYETDARSIIDRATSSKRDTSEFLDDDDIPDTSKAGFYCRLCESHMNNEDMWISHVNGKRHKANRKKTEGSMPSKIKYIARPGARARLMDKLEAIDGPIVGLKHIRETLNHLNNETYQCFLCGASLIMSAIIPHLLSQKHRLKFLQKINHRDLQILENMNANDRVACSIVEDICNRIDEKFGPGPEVFVVKSNFPV